MKPGSNSKKTFLQRHLMLIVFIGISIIWISCEKDYHYVEPAAVIPPPDTSSTDSTVALISFNDSIQPIFIANCAVSGCHDGSEDLDLRTGHSYTSLFSQGDIDTIISANSELYKRIILPSTDGDFMPQDGSPLSNSDKEKILKWIQEGAKNN
jgi:hypothetical protein